jgi:hypothetical protein
MSDQSGVSDDLPGEGYSPPDAVSVDAQTSEHDRGDSNGNGAELAAVTPPPDTPVEEWNPLASVELVELPVPSSDGRASITVKPWSGRERLAYEDQLLARFLVEGKAEDGEDPAGVPDVVKLATMRLVGASLTLQGSTGFPPRTDGSTMFTGSKARVEADLLALSEPVYAEIRELCLLFQPLPRAQLVTDDGDNGEGGADASDPSPTPSTPAEDASDG